MVLAGSIWVQRMLEEFHKTPLGGHAGAFHTTLRLSATVYWIGMKREVYLYVAGCDVC